MSNNSNVAAEYAARARKAARYSAHFFASGIKADDVARIPLSSPAWALLGKALKVKPPGSQETLDLICQCVREFEQARDLRIRQDTAAFDVRNLQEA